MKIVRRILRGQSDLIGSGVTKFLPNRHQILLACMPKSGSTFLSNSIGRLDGFRKTRLTRSYGRSEQEIDPLTALRRTRHNYIAQHHVKFNENTESILRASFTSGIGKGSDGMVRRTSSRNGRQRPRGCDRGSGDPWYINFYASWCYCEAATRFTYEEVKDDAPRGMKNILDEAKCPISHKEIEHSLRNSRAGTNRLNIGVSGRG